MTSRILLLSFLAVGCSEYELSPGTEADDPKHDDEDPGIDDEGEDTTPDPSEVGSISGRICSPNEAKYVAGADVWVETESGDITTETDGDGWFLLEGVPAGTHTVYVQSGSFTTDFEVLVEADEVTELPTEECLNDDVIIAVVTGEYDSIGEILNHLGLEYTTIRGTYGSSEYINFLRNPSQLAEYDIIFFNCGEDDRWTSYQSEIAANLQDFVENGGSIYTSDWRYYIVEAAYPEMITFHGDDSRPGAAYVGDGDQYVSATVIDSDMSAALGSSTARLYYDLDIWAAPNRVNEGSTLLRGTYTWTDWSNWSTGSEEGPLAATMEVGDGKVLYTSFHNEKQSTVDMDVLLEQIIFSL